MHPLSYLWVDSDLRLISLLGELPVLFITGNSIHMFFSFKYFDCYSEVFDVLLTASQETVGTADVAI